MIILDALSIKDWFVIIVAIIIGFLVIRFIAEVLIKIIGSIIVIGFAVYLLFFWNGGLLDLGNKDFMLFELKEKYCDSNYNEVKCNCIVMPIYNEIQTKYTEQQINEFKTNKIKSITIIFETLIHKRSEIHECLKQNNALQAWDEFIDEFRSFDTDNKFSKTYEELLEK